MWDYILRFPNRRTRNSHFQLLFAADERPSSPVQRRCRRFKLPCTADVCIKGHSQPKNNKIIDATSNEKSSNLKPAPSRELRIQSKNAGDLIFSRCTKLFTRSRRLTRRRCRSPRTISSSNCLEPAEIKIGKPYSSAWGLGSLSD